MTFSSSYYTLFCYAFVHPCSFGRSLSTMLAGRVINHFCTRYAIFFVFVEYCHLLEFYVKCAALYRTFIPQSIWNTRCGCPRGRKFHLTRSLVASEGWSLVRDRTNRKHCSSHEIWSYKRDGRWWGCSFDRGSTVVTAIVHWRTSICGSCFTKYGHISGVPAINPVFIFGWRCTLLVIVVPNYFFLQIYKKI